MLLRCTRKLLAALDPGVAVQPLTAPDAEDWYANLVYFDRRKCLLLTHAGTLFTIFEADVRVQQLRPAHGFLIGLWNASWPPRSCPPTRSAGWVTSRSSPPGRLTAASSGA